MGYMLRYYILTLIILFFSPPLLAESNYVIGLAQWSGYPESIRGFKDGLREAGLLEGRNVKFLLGELGADEKLQENAAKTFKEKKVNLIYSLTTPGTAIMKAIMPQSTPIVFSIVTYPADSGLIESFEYSGNNLVGTSNYVSLKYYLDILKLMLPHAKRVAIFHRKGEPNSKIQASNLIRLLSRNGVHVEDVEVKDIAEIEKYANSLALNVDAFITTTDTLIQSGGENKLIDISLKKGIPILSSNKKGIEQGATFGVVADFYILGKMSGKMAADILQRGVSPASIQSLTQTPPFYLANRQSINKLDIKLSKLMEKKVTWTK